MKLTPKEIRQIRDHLVDAIRGISAIMIDASSRHEADTRLPVPAPAASTPRMDSSPRVTKPEEIGPRLNYTIDEAGRALSLGRTTIYKLIGSGDLQTLRIGSRRLIPARSIEELLSRP